MEKDGEVDRKRGGKTIFKNGQLWTLSARLGQLKTGQGGSCCKVIYSVPTTCKGHGID